MENAHPVLYSQTLFPSQSSDVFLRSTGGATIPERVETDPGDH